MNKFLIFILFIIITAVVIYKLHSYILRNTIIKLSKQVLNYFELAKHDKNPLTSMLRANYSIAYLWAMEDIASQKNIENIIAIDFTNFKNHITSFKDNANKKLIKWINNKNHFSNTTYVSRN